jgi:hypothetical protein
MKERETLKINAQGHLEIGGMDTVVLANTFPPLYTSLTKPIFVV